MGVVDKFKEFVAPIDDEGDDILEVEEEVEETPRSRYERPKTKNVNTANTMKAKTKMVLFEPRSFSESDEVAKRLKEGNAVVVNLHKLDREYAQRTIDFLTGVVFALDDKDKIAEPRASCVVHRKVNDAVPLLVNGLHLLEPAEAAAHSSGPNDKFRCLILHVKCLLQVTASIVSVPTEDCKPFSQEILLPTRMACERRAFVVHYVKSRLNPNMKRGE